MTDDLVFICYSRSESTLALELARHLRDGGIPAWVDQHDIPAGARWDDAIDAALRKAGAVVAILSAPAMASDQVKDELRYARERGIRIVPLLATPCEVPYWLARVQYIDATSSFDTALSSLLRELRGDSAADLPRPSLYDRLFPVREVFPGRTTESELLALGAVHGTSEDADIRIGYRFDDDPALRFLVHNGVVFAVQADVLVVMSGDPVPSSATSVRMPLQWRETGMSYQLSFGEWKQWFQSQELVPTTKRVDGTDTSFVLSADVEDVGFGSWTLEVCLTWISQGDSTATIPDVCQISVTV